MNNLQVNDQQRIKDKRQKKKKFYLIVFCLVLFCLFGIAFLVVAYQRYTTVYAQDMSLAQDGIQRLRIAVTLLEALSRNPFDAPTVEHAQSEFTTALTLFMGLDHDLKAWPSISTSLPIYGARLNAAEHLLPLAIELSQVGVIACKTLNLLISKFQDPLDTSGLTMTDLTIADQNFQQIKTTLNLVFEQVSHLGPEDVQLDPRIGKLVAIFHKNMPALQTWLNEIGQLLPVVPALLGVDTTERSGAHFNSQTNYLIELLDSTELRPTGGFIGNYGIATFSGGRLKAASITDTYLLDTPYLAAGHRIPYPTAYPWFDLSPQSWSFRDSNLDADFPTAARYAEQTYQIEGGKVPVQGVIALTPALVAHALTITGPINVPEYQETITAQNLVARIHYYQLRPAHAGSSLLLSPDGKSSQRKHFVALLAEHFLARLHQLPSSAFPTILHLLIAGVRSKDVQIYFNISAVEHLLQQFHLDAAIQSSPGDGLFVVDANISANKANSLITSVLNDQVTIDAQGNAIHHTTMSYAWTGNGQLYGSNVYRDYVRVYVPPDSILQAQQGWQPRGTSEAFGREVWAGFFTLTFRQTRTITLLWTAPGVAQQEQNGWRFQYIVQRQAGANWMLHLSIHLPSCAVITNTLGGFLSPTQHVATLTEMLEEDTSLEVDYARPGEASKPGGLTAGCQEVAR